MPLVETPVGFKYVGDAMRRGPVVVGGEESGGLSVSATSPRRTASCQLPNRRGARGGRAAPARGVGRPGAGIRARRA
ncbi:hypothetical protein [Calditerricola satsumensis]|uniref:hypothetical protein n=1 Tax=Calditerricola satsumensis TaxID=373054 RepID=UPI003570F6ED